MSAVVESLIVAAVVLPFIACAIAALNANTPRTSLTGGVCLLLVAASGILSLLAAIGQWQQGDAATIRVSLGRWFEIPSRLPLVVELQLQATDFSLWIAFVSSTVAALAGWHWLSTRSTNNHLLSAVAAISLMVAGCMTGLMAGNLVLLLCGWVVCGAAACWLLNLPGESVPQSAAARRMLLQFCLSDLLLLLSIAMLWSNFGSITLDEVFDSAESRQLAVEQNPAFVSLTAMMILAAVVARCCLFPLMGVMGQAERWPPHANALLQCVGPLPLAICLIFRSQPLFAATIVPADLMMWLGGITALVCALIGLAKSQLQTSFSFLSVSSYGLMIVGIGSGNPWGIEGALWLLTAHACLKSAQFLIADDLMQRTGTVVELKPPDSESPRPGFSASPLLVTTIVLACGFWGPHLILRGIQASQAIANETANHISDWPLRTANVVPTEISLWVVALTALLVMTLAMFRIVFLAAQFQGTASNSTEDQPRGLWVISLLTLLGLLAAPILSAVFRHDAHSWISFDPMTEGFQSVLIVLAAGVAWVLFRQWQQWPRFIVDLVESPSRIARQHFFLDDFFSLGLILPARGMAQLCRFFDWFLIDGILISLPSKLVGLVSRWSHPLRSENPQFYAVAFVLAVASLLSAILWAGD